MGKSQLSEEDIKARYITPAITAAGWDINKQVRLEYAFTAGRIILRGNITARGKQKRADYLLSYKSNFPLAEFPSPEALYQRYRIDKGIDATKEKVMFAPYYFGMKPEWFSSFFNKRV